MQILVRFNKFEKNNIRKMKDRLQFRHHSQVFDTREAAIEYIQSQIRFAEEGLAATNKELGYSLFAEPISQ